VLDVFKIGSFELFVGTGFELQYSSSQPLISGKRGLGGRLKGP
jgi:hypothetical protein